MKKQKICIIGGSLTGLVTAIGLSKLNCTIDLVTDNIDQNLRFNRTIAISKNNFDFLNKLHISQSFKKEVWPCSIMELYAGIKNEEFSKVFELNKKNKKEKVLYILENSKIMKIMMNKIKKIKSISIKKNTKIFSIFTSGSLKSVKYKNNSSMYNLVIVCTGSNSDLIKNIFNDQIIKNSYEELAMTVTLNHDSFENNTARQFFLDNEILALLPMSKTKSSVVWSVKKNIYKKNDLFLKKKIKFYLKNYLKNMTFASKIEYKDLNFLIRNKYFIDRTLLFGDALHVIHPFVGQGFNMTLRDLASLKTLLTNKINLGLDIGSSDILTQFSAETKPGNFVFSVSTDILKNYLSVKNRYFKEIRNNLFKTLNKSDFAKNIFFNIADKGFKF